MERQYLRLHGHILGEFLMGGFRAAPTIEARFVTPDLFRLSKPKGQDPPSWSYSIPRYQWQEMVTFGRAVDLP